MLHFDQIEELACLVSTFDRESATRQLLEFHCEFPVDFSREFLEDQSLERLQHLLFALCVQSQHMPEVTAEAATV